MRSRSAWIIPTALSGAVLLLLGVVAFRSAGPPADLDGAWSWFGPTNVAVALGSVLLAGVAYAAYAIPRRREGRPLALLAVIVLALIAIGLGATSIANCLPMGDLLGGLWQTMTLFVGTSPPVFEEVPRCASGGVPLAAQIARFAAMAAVFGGAVALVGALATNQVDRLLNRWRRYDEVVVGVDAQALPLIRTLVEWSSALAGGARREVVVLSLEGQDAAASDASEIGARVFKVSTETGPAVRLTSTSELEALLVAQMGRALTPFLLTGDRVGVNRIWIMDPDLGRALTLRTAVHNVLSSARGRDDRPVRVVVRCDDASAVTRLRAGFIDDAARETDSRTLSSAAVLDDTVCLHEVTAAQVVGRVARSMDGPHYALVVCGDTPLAQAIVAEVALRTWEDSLLAAAWDQHLGECSCAPWHGPGVPGDDPDDLLIGGVLPTQVVVVSRTATALIEAAISGLSPDCRAVVVGPDGSRGSPAASLRVDPLAKDWRRITTADLPDLPALAFVLTEPLDPDEAHLPGRLANAAQRRTVRKWVRSDSADHRSWSLRDPGCEGFADDLLLRDALPDDLWTRIARLSHEAYRRQYYEPDNGFRYPWWATDENQRLQAPWRDDNIDQVRLLLANVVHRGYSWQRQDDPSHAPSLSDEDWIEISSSEHERWCGVRRAQGWEYGETKAPLASPPSHSDLRRWNDLDDGSKAKVDGSLKRLVDLLAAFGYTPTRVDGQGT